ncbi:MAG TPA: hypothetical protein VLH77_04345, partial [Gammaproteobacteria bacterium]|nr:hypothetical protein [Gammaproteobacteria bacterium]
SNEAPSMRRGFFAKAKDALTKNPYPAPKGPGVLSSFAAAPLPHTNDFGADLARIRVNSDEKLRSQTEPIIQPESISEQVVVSDASTMAEASSAKGWLARAAERAKAAFPKLPEWNRKDASGVRSAAAEAAAFVAEVLEANKPLQEEVAVAQAVHSYDHAGPAFGLPLFGYERLIESNGFIVDTSGNKVADPVAEDFKKRESLNDRLLNGARTRLNGIVSRFGNKASSVLSVVGRHGARKELTLEEMINDTSHMSKGLREMMAHSKEQVVDTGEALAAAIVDQSVDILSQEENDESKVVVKTGLLRARLSGAFNRAQLEGLHAANTLLANKGKVATLAGGGTLALLALVHPDIFNQMGDLVGSIGHGTLGGGGHHEGILEHARNMPGSEHATNMPGVEHGSSVAGIHVATPGAESLTHISAPNIDPSIHSSLSSPDVSHALNFSDFISQSTDVKPGDSLWTIVSGHAAQSGDWVNSATGVTKGDVLADITRKFIEHSGHGPLVLHPGEAFSISNLNLQQDQLSVLQDAFNTTSSDQYLNEVMPKLNQVLAASR